MLLLLLRLLLRGCWCLRVVLLAIRECARRLCVGIDIWRVPCHRCTCVVVLDRVILQRMRTEEWDNMVKTNAPAACPHRTGTPDAHSSLAGPSSTALAVAVLLPLTSLASSVDVGGLAGSRSALEGGHRRVKAALPAIAAGSSDSARLTQGSPPPSTLLAGFHPTHSLPVHHYRPLLSRPVWHNSPRSRSMSRAYYLLVPHRGQGSH